MLPKEIPIVIPLQRMSHPVWQKISEQLKANLPGHTFHSLIESLNAPTVSDEEIAFQFTDDFSKTSFQEKCLPTLKNVLHELKMQQVNVALSVLATQEPANIPAPHIVQRGLYDSQYTFDAFVVGTSNQFAHAACQAVVKQPGQCYNPLFIFGGSGLGKTHLLKAIGYELHRADSNLRINFLTGEGFTNELILAIRQDRMREFRDKYRTGCDVLLLDDIHFLAGKERTQEEFFYTFNYLHDARKQIVITSDRYPKDIKDLENRLQTRFEWGLVADVQPPEIETRIAILQNKAAKEGFVLPDDVAEYIASHITTNIRDLEGSLKRLQAYASMSGQPISHDLALTVLKDIAPKTRHELDAEGIIRTVALHFSITGADIRSDRRTRKLTIPRQICMYLLRKHLALSGNEIARLIGKKDHTTIIHGIGKISDDMKSNPELLAHVTAIESLFR